MENLTILLCSQADAEFLAALNKQLIEDEMHDNTMDVSHLEERMIEYLSSNYKAYFFKSNEVILGYALVDMKREPLYLRQFFICTEHRRKGYGSAAFNRLLDVLGTGSLDIEVLWWNKRAIEFWSSLGFCERSIYMRYNKKF